MTTFTKILTGMLVCGGALLSGCTTANEITLYNDTASDTSGGVRIEIPRGVTIEAVDGHSVKTGAMMPLAHRRILRLRPGPHTLQAYYEVIYETQDEEYTKFTTKTTTLDVDLASDAAYRMIFDDPWADKLAEHPSEDDINMRLEQLSRPGPGPAGITPSTPLEATPVTSSGKTPDPEQEALDALKAAWRKASTADRATFQSWIIPHGD